MIFVDTAEAHGTRGKLPATASWISEEICSETSRSDLTPSYFPFKEVVRFGEALKPGPNRTDDLLSNLEGTLPLSLLANGLLFEVLHLLMLSIHSHQALANQLSKVAPNYF